MMGVTPCLWFDTQAEEAVDFYTSIIKDSRKGTVAYYGDAGYMPAGTVLSVELQIQGQPFLAINGGPMFQFTPAVSFILNCENQDEVDELWERLSEGGVQEQCGWLRDRYGLSWQVTPVALMKYMKDPDSARVARVTKAMMQMQKLDIAALEAAYRG